MKIELSSYDSIRIQSALFVMWQKTKKAADLINDTELKNLAQELERIYNLIENERKAQGE